MYMALVFVIYFFNIQYLQCWEVNDATQCHFRYPLKKWSVEVIFPAHITNHHLHCTETFGSRKKNIQSWKFDKSCEYDMHRKYFKVLILWHKVYGVSLISSVQPYRWGWLQCNNGYFFDKGGNRSSRGMSTKSTNLSGNNKSCMTNTIYRLIWK